MNIASRAASLACLSLLCAAAATAAASSVTVQVRDGSGKAVADAVLYVEAAGGAVLARTAGQAEIVQKGLRFDPLVSVVQAGSTIAFPNRDRVKHHIYSFSPAKKFDQKLYSGVAAAPQVFDKAGTVVLGCNIHDRMIAYVKVVDTPYFARSDAAGVARIELPGAGKYTLRAWHFNMLGADAGEPLEAKAGDTAASVVLAMKAPLPESAEAAK